MIDFRSAIEQVLSEAATPEDEELLECRAAVDRCLAESIDAPSDLPRAAKSLMDGYAVRAADLEAGVDRFRIVETIPAGYSAKQSVGPGQAARIMTGGLLPQGADTVVQRERARSGAGSDEVQLRGDDLSIGSNVAPQGSSMRRGERIWTRGHRIRSLDIGLLAEFGRSTVRVVPQPTVSLLTTGDEVVSPGAELGPAQLYNSNGPLLAALLGRCGAQVHDLGIVADRTSELSAAVQRGLQSDLLVVTGGVSAGDWDLVPQTFEQTGVENRFHGVALRPGKPIWFGVRRASGEADRKTLVFGLPGNPMSALVCYRLFVQPALRRRGGEGSTNEELIGWKRATLSADWTHTARRPTFWPARTECTSGTVQLEPLSWQGSFDLRPLADADALAFLEPGEYQFAAGASIDYVSLDQ